MSRVTILILEVQNDIRRYPSATGAVRGLLEATINTFAVGNQEMQERALEFLKSVTADMGK
jgi:hypothetical protein